MNTLSMPREGMNHDMWPGLGKGVDGHFGEFWDIDIFFILASLRYLGYHDMILHYVATGVERLITLKSCFQNKGVFRSHCQSLH